MVSQALEDVLKRDQKAAPKPIMVSGMIDTGATNTVIQEGLAKKLGLKPIGLRKITTPSSVDVECLTYQLRLDFPNGPKIEVVAIEAPLQAQHIQCLIGRDILSHGVFVYTGYVNTFTLSF